MVAPQGGQLHDHKEAGSGPAGVRRHFDVSSKPQAVREYPLQRMLAAIGEEISDVFQRLALELLSQVRQRKQEPELCLQLRAGAFQKGPLSQPLRGPGRRARVGLDGVPPEALAHALRQLVKLLVDSPELVVKRSRADGDEAHLRGAVVGLEPAPQCVHSAGVSPLWTIVECLDVPCVEVAGWIRRVGEGVHHLVDTPHGVLDILGMFTCNRVDLLLHVLVIKERGPEKVSKPVKSLLGGVLRNITIIERHLRRSERVVVATVHGHEVPVAIGIRELLGAQEEHVLAKMGQPRQVGRVVKGARLHC
mmetsp:Transcript_35146/g.100388  ORF Transcript_35146/g.100388 Transcript_35146/m.100388 type:complete len:306 (-) Transcript_35146:322-1239(-)